MVAADVVDEDEPRRSGRPPGLGLDEGPPADGRREPAGGPRAPARASRLDEGPPTDGRRARVSGSVVTGRAMPRWPPADGRRVLRDHAAELVVLASMKGPPAGGRGSVAAAPWGAPGKRASMKGRPRTGGELHRVLAPPRKPQPASMK